MTHLSDDEIRRIAAALAPQLVTRVRESHHEFWIDPAEHYQDHMEIRQIRESFTPEFMQSLKEIAESFQNGRRIFWKMFLTMVALGAIGFVAKAFFSDFK